ncbi:hypothetical protein [Flindersiella endophytica]
MTIQATTARVIRLFEITLISADPGTNALQDMLVANGDHRVTIVPTPGLSPWILVQTADVDAHELHDMIGMPVSITELRKHVQVEHADLHGLAHLIATVDASGVAIGRAATERAIQRRRLDILVLAADLDPAYTTSIEKVIAEAQQHIQVIISDLTTAELGQATGCRRAGCVGLLRNRQTHSLGSR